MVVKKKKKQEPVKYDLCSHCGCIITPQRLKTRDATEAILSNPAMTSKELSKLLKCTPSYITALRKRLGLNLQREYK